MESINSFFQFAHTLLISKCVKPLESMERDISGNLEKANILTRPADNNGIWCHILVPTILITYAYFDEVSLLYKIVSCISLGLMCYGTLFLLFLTATSETVIKPQYSGTLTSSLIATIILYIFLNQGLQFSLCITLLSTLFFSVLLRMCLTKCQNTFTIGESMIVCQSAVLFVMMAVIKFFFEFHSGDEDMEFIGVIVFTVLSTVGLIVTALCVLTDSQRHLTTLGYIVGSAAIFVLLILHSILGFDCLPTILRYIFVENDRIQIFTFWLSLLILAICVLLIRTKLAVKASTVTRKTFHVLASLVFMSGILFDVNLMMLAAGIGLGVLIFVEALRKSGIEPVSSALQSAFLVYSDEKDSGLFAMTPIYLYAGLAFPLLIVPARDDRELELLSGVLSIGVGDTAASWFGSKYGFHKWSGSDRSYEGTAFNILSQIGTVYALELFGLLNTRCALLRTTFAAVVSGLVEAKTDQVDNLVLPLVTMMAFQFTWIFC